MYGAKRPEYSEFSRESGVGSQEWGVGNCRLTPDSQLLTGLPYRLIQHNPDSRRQIETPHRPAHRYGEALLRMLLQDSERHALGFTAEHQAAVGAIRSGPVALLRLGREVEA